MKTKLVQVLLLTHQSTELDKQTQSIDIYDCYDPIYSKEGGAEFPLGFLVAVLDEDENTRYRSVYRILRVHGIEHVINGETEEIRIYYVVERDQKSSWIAPKRKNLWNRLTDLFLGTDWDRMKGFRRAQYIPVPHSLERIKVTPKSGPEIPPEA